MSTVHTKNTHTTEHENGSRSTRSPRRHVLRPPTLNLPRNANFLSCGGSLQAPAPAYGRIQEENENGNLWSVCVRKGRRRAVCEDSYSMHTFVPVCSKANSTDDIPNAFEILSIQPHFLNGSDIDKTRHSKLEDESPAHFQHCDIHSSTNVPCDFDKLVNLFCVFDGHGGRRAAQFASKRLPLLIVSFLRAGIPLDHALKGAFLRTDEQLWSSSESRESIAKMCKGIDTVSKLSQEQLRRTSSGSSFGKVALQSGDASSSNASLTLTRAFTDVHDSNNDEDMENNSGDMLSRACSIDFGRRQDGLGRRRKNGCIDERLSRHSVKIGQGCGTTATAVALKGTQMTIAHVGDSRAVLGKSNGSVVRLCEDHRPQRVDEMERIAAAGGVVLDGGGVARVNGVLAVSRSIGDNALKDVVIAQPDITSVTLQENDEIVIIATDGLWDVVSDEESVSHVLELFPVDESVKNRKGCGGGESDGDVSAEQTAVKKLVRLAWERGTKDDICVAIINVRKYRMLHVNVENNQVVAHATAAQQRKSSHYASGHIVKEEVHGEDGAIPMGPCTSRKRTTQPW